MNILQFVQRAHFVTSEYLDSFNMFIFKFYIESNIVTIRVSFTPIYTAVNKVKIPEIWIQYFRQISSEIVQIQEIFGRLNLVH